MNIISLKNKKGKILIASFLLSIFVVETSFGVNAFTNKFSRENLLKLKGAFQRNPKRTVAAVSALALTYPAFTLVKKLQNTESRNVIKTRLQGYRQRASVGLNGLRDHLRDNLTQENVKKVIAPTMAVSSVMGVVGMVSQNYPLMALSKVLSSACFAGKAYLMLDSLHSTVDNANAVLTQVEDAAIPGQVSETIPHLREVFARGNTILTRMDEVGDRTKLRLDQLSETVAQANRFLSQLEGANLPEQMTQTLGQFRSDIERITPEVQAVARRWQQGLRGDSDARVLYDQGPGRDAALLRQTQVAEAAEAARVAEAASQERVQREAERAQQIRSISTSRNILSSCRKEIDELHQRKQGRDSKFEMLEMPTSPDDQTSLDLSTEDEDAGDDDESLSIRLCTKARSASELVNKLTTEENSEVARLEKATRERDFYKSEIPVLRTELQNLSITLLTNSRSLVEINKEIARLEGRSEESVIEEAAQVPEPECIARDITEIVSHQELLNIHSALSARIFRAKAGLKTAGKQSRKANERLSKARAADIKKRDKIARDAEKEAKRQSRQQAKKDK